jgi:hypothetical protein
MRRVRDYSAEEVAAVDTGVQLVFARDDAGPPPAAGCRVRFHAALETFTIYPRTARDLAVNELLWRAVRDSSFRSDTWPAAATPRRVFALGIPDALARYLQCVSVEEMHDSVLCMLADTARGEDGHVLHEMRRELAPPVWDQLSLLLTRGAHQRRRRQPPASPRAAAARRSRTPTKLRRGQDSCLFASYMLDQALQKAEEHDYWRIAITGATFEPATAAATAASSAPHENDQAVTMHSLYNDWQLYAQSCMIAEAPRVRGGTGGGGRRCAARPLSPVVGPGGISRPEATGASARRTRAERRQVRQTMMTLVLERRQAETWARAAAVLACADDDGSYFATLPHHVVQHCILPKVVLEDVRPSQADKSVAVFQTLDVAPH